MPDPEGELVELQSHLTPQEAQIFTGMLQAAGIPASAGDLHLVQTDALLSIAVGGCRVRVPAERLPEARALLEAFARGDLALDDDFDPQGPGPAQT